MQLMRMVTTLLLLVLFAGPTAAPAILDGPGGPELPTAEPGGLLFIENAGQWPEDARFQVWGGGQTLWLAEDAVWLTQVEGSKVEGFKVEGFKVDEANLQPSNFQPATVQTVNIRLSFPGANPQPVLEPFDRLETHVSYFIGADPAKWRPDVPVWGGVRYRDLYPGLDLEISGAGGQWSWRLVRDQQLAFSSQQSAVSGQSVTLRVEGADAVAVDGAVLHLSIALGELAVPLLAADRSNAQGASVARANGQAFDVTAPFAAAQANPTSAMPEAAGHAVADPAPRDASSPQSGDLLYATFLGGSGWDNGLDIAVDGAGQAYVTGGTYSTDFPASLGPGYDTSYNGAYDAFVVKLNAAGAALGYATFLGGSGGDVGYGIAVNAAGQAYVTGTTGSADFPASLGPGYDASFNGGSDAFVVKLDAAGAGLLYATFLGGGSDDSGRGIALDGAGQTYVTGTTGSADFPASLGPGYDTGFNGGADAFVAKLDAAGAALRYATFLGGSGGEEGGGIVVDSAGQAYVTGTTESADFPASLGPGYDTIHNGGHDAFVVKLDAAGAALRYATFLGGSSYEHGYGIAVDGAGQAYVTGETWSDDFPASLGPGYDTTFNGTIDAFVVKLNATGAALGYATFLGGGSYDQGSGIAVDGTGRAYVTGTTESANFPASLGPGYDTSFNGPGVCYKPYLSPICGDAFVVKLDAAGAALHYATFLGGGGYDYGYGIAVDGAGQAYVTGETWSGDFPASLGPGYDTSFNDGYVDAYAVKLATLSAGRITALRAGARPIIDGDVQEWDGLNATFLNQTNAATITGETPAATDLSLRLRAAWTPDTLYFGATIWDDVLVGNNSAYIWGDDAIELGIRTGSTTHQFTVALDGRQADLGNPITSLTVATRTVPGGWALEVAIPAAALGLSALAADQAHPFTIGLWDDDFFTYPGQTHMIWRGTSTNTYQPEWGTLSLSSTVYDFPPAATQTPTPTSTATLTLTPTTTPTSTATPTETPTMTPTATPTQTPTASRTPTLTATPTMSPTATLTQTPTVTPTPIPQRTWLPVILR